MSRSKCFAGAVTVAVGALLIVAIPASATTRTVHPGQSIQAAIDLSSPGDKVVVKPGTYREYLQIVDKDRITLRGQRATLKPAATATPTLCNSMGDLTGVCVVGRLGPPVGDNPPPVLRPSESDRITGFKISGFKSNAVFGFGTRSLRVDHNALTKNGEYGVFSNTSTRTRLDHNVVKGNTGEAGLYVGDSQSAHAVVTRNKVTNNAGSGIFLRDASHGTVSRNRVSGSCVGIYLLGDAPGPVGHWRIGRNKVLRNNRECKATTGDEGGPALSGLGIALAGADHTKVTRNVIHGHRKKHPSAVYGGIAIVRAGLTSGTVPVEDLISRNVATRNRPDINWDGTGSVSFKRNTCNRSQPASVCH
jgi:parallel beta-helix repeat protein